eukprot:350422-Chlamydomonas_euryale.AAC.8
MEWKLRQGEGMAGWQQALRPERGFLGAGERADRDGEGKRRDRSWVQRGSGKGASVQAYREQSSEGGCESWVQRQQGRQAR